MRIINMIVIYLFLFGCFTACRENHNTSISVNESGSRYIFSASFPDKKTPNVQQVLRKRLSPYINVHTLNDYLDVNATLQDNTSLWVKTSPGVVRIVIDRQGSSSASYKKVKDICSAVKDVLKD